jgi:hypothetical protein
MTAVGLQWSAKNLEQHVSMNSAEYDFYKDVT